MNFGSTVVEKEEEEEEKEKEEEEKEMRLNFCFILKDVFGLSYDVVFVVVY